MLERRVLEFVPAPVLGVRISGVDQAVDPSELFKREAYKGVYRLCVGEVEVERGRPVVYD